MLLTLTSRSTTLTACIYSHYIYSHCGCKKTLGYLNLFVAKRNQSFYVKHREIHVHVWSHCLINKYRFFSFFYSRHDGDSSVSLLRIFERRAYELRYLFFAYQYLWKCICEISISFCIFFSEMLLKFLSQKAKEKYLDGVIFTLKNVYISSWNIARLDIPLVVFATCTETICL